MRRIPNRRRLGTSQTPRPKLFGRCKSPPSGEASDRKQRAVQAVREARAQGIEAYYYHGDSISSVCVGAWPREAVKEQDSAVAHSADPNATIFITDRPLPPTVNSDMRDREGNRLTVIAPKLEITDPGMAEAIPEIIQIMRSTARTMPFGQRTDS